MKRLFNWIGRVIRRTLIGFCLIIAFFILALFFGENPTNYFNPREIGNALYISFSLALFWSLIPPRNKNKSKDKAAAPKNVTPAPEPEDEASPPEQKQRGSSRTAKAAFGLGLAALAKSGPPSRQPSAYGVSGGVQVIGVQHRGGKTWRVHYRYPHPAGHTVTDWADFGTATSGLSAGAGGQIRIDWS